MTISRRKFAKLTGASAAVTVVAWKQASAQVAQTGEVDAETVGVLLDAQGPRGIYEQPEHFERLRRAVANVIRTQDELRSFPLSDDEQPLTIFQRG